MGLAGSTEKACDAVEKMLKDNTDAGLTQRDIGADYTKIGQDLTDALIYTAMLAQTIGLDWELSIDHMIVKCEGRSVAP